MNEAQLDERELLLSREDATVMDVLQSESRAELQALVAQVKLEAPECDTPLLRKAVEAVLAKFEAFGVKAEPNKVSVQRTPTPRAPYSPQRTKQFVVVNMDITWSARPQVQVLAEIIRAHADPGDVIDEEFVIKWVRHNAAALGVSSPERAERVWKIYYGDHDEGFVGHGNLVRVR